MRDPYTVLGVARSATDKDIKSAFRKLAKTYHPDSNTSKDASTKFAEATNAYDLLSDKDKRAAFDRGEIGADGSPKFQGFGGGAGFDADAARRGFRGFRPRGGFKGFGAGGMGTGGMGEAAGSAGDDPFADLFANFGGGPSQTASAPKGGDLTGTMTVDFSEAMLGAKKRVDLGGRVLDVTVPAGIEDGKQIRLRGQGTASPFGGQAGDALVTVRVAPHPLFKREGADLRLDLPVSLDEAVLGAKVKVPTLEGPVMLAIAPGSNTGRVLRLRGKGAAKKAGRGDILVTLKVVLPDDVSGLKDDAEALRAAGGASVRGPAFPE